jgi:hypothetical protein
MLSVCSVYAFARMCTVFCGNNEETGAHLSDLLLRNPSQGVDDNIEASISHIIADCYSQAKKNSTEKRVLRACLTPIPRAKMSERFPNRPNFTLSCDSYAAGRADLVTLLSGEKMKSETRSLRRCEDAEVSKVVRTIIACEHQLPVVGDEAYQDRLELGFISRHQSTPVKDSNL